MENLIFGILTFIFCVAGFIKAYLLNQAGNVGKALSWIILCGLLLRIFTAADFHLHEWDERYHALVAKNIIESPLKPTLYKDPVLPYDYKSWSDNHIWLHKQPAPLWAMGLSLKLFGINEMALRIPSILLSTIAIWLTFQIGLFFFNKKVALIAAFLHAIHGLTIEITAGRVATDHVDLFFLFFIELGLLFAVLQIKSQKLLYSCLTGIAIGLAILTKWLPAFIVLGVWGLLAMDRKYDLKKITFHAAVILFFTALTALPWQLYISQHYPLEAQWEFLANKQHFLEGIDGHGKPWYYHLEKIARLFGWFVYFILIWFFAKSFKATFKGRFKNLALSSWIIVPYIFFSIAGTKMKAYTLFTGPAFFLITALGVALLNRYRSAFKSQILVRVLQLGIMVLPILHSIERVKPFTNLNRSPDWSQALKTMYKEIEGDQVIVFQEYRPIEAMFHNNIIAYPSPPPIGDTLSQLQEKGYDLYVKQGQHLSRINPAEQ